MYGGAANGAVHAGLTARRNSMGFALRIVIAAAVASLIVLGVVGIPVLICIAVVRFSFFGIHSAAFAGKPMLFRVPGLRKSVLLRHDLFANAAFALMGFALILGRRQLVPVILAHIADAVFISVLVKVELRTGPVSAYITDGIVIVGIGLILSPVIGMRVFLLRMGVGRRGGQQAEHQRQSQHKA